MMQQDHHKLTEYVRQHVGRPFAWGTEDCATLALGWIDTLLGTNHLERIAGRYSTPEEALRFAVLHGLNWSSLLEELGASPVRCNFQQTGDLITQPGGHFETVGIIVRRHYLTIDEAVGQVVLRRWHHRDPWQAWRLICAEVANGEE